MSNAKSKPLNGVRIAVFVEHKFVPDEISCYRERFEEYGATVEFFSRIYWGAYRPGHNDWKTPVYYGDVDPLSSEPCASPEKLTVDENNDVSNFDPGDFHAVIMSANHTSIRLLYTDETRTQSPREYVQSSPVAAAFATAMYDNSIIKGALCHGLWILTPFPELLKGRNVTCHTVLAAQVLNCDANIQFEKNAEGLQTPQKIVVDDDLVTGFSASEAGLFVDAIRDAILSKRAQADGPYQTGPGSLDSNLGRAGQSSIVAKRSGLVDGQTKASNPCLREEKDKTMAHKVLIFVSQYGFWAEELLFPLRHLREAGIPYDFMLNKRGIAPFPDGGSLDANMIDGPLGRKVNNESIVEEANATDFGQLFAESLYLHEKLPSVRPYLSSGNYLEAMENHFEEREKSWKIVDDYGGLLLVGGSGPVVDMVNNSRLHDLILGFYYADKPIAAECYAVACLAFAREFDDRRCIIRGKNVTGHTLEYDYTAGWQLFVNDGPLIYDDPPFPLEHILRDAVGPEGKFHGNVGKKLSVIADYPFITSRSVGESDLCGKLFVESLVSGLKRFGW